MPSPAAYAALRAAVDRHASACAAARLPDVEATLLLDARITLVDATQTVSLTPEAFGALLAARSTDPAAYCREIASLSLAGRIACATLVEDGLMGANHLSHLHLVRDGDKWRVTARLMMQVG